MSFMYTFNKLISSMNNQNWFLLPASKNLRGFQRGRGGIGMNWEFGVSRCNLFHLKWVKFPE